MAVSSVEWQKLPIIDVAEHILAHLGVKDLMRYKSVSRSWLALINSSRFIEKHLLVQKSKRERKIIATKNHTFDKNEDVFLKIYSLSPDRQEPQICVQPSTDRNLGVVGSCDGLLCLLSEPDRRLLYVWNPSTREQPRTCYIGSSYVKGIGFGYDEISCDYKAVKISAWEDKSNVEVWSLKSHGWREVESSSFPWLAQQDYHMGSSVLVGKKLYWLALNSFTHEDPIVVYFDLGDETIRAILMPDAIPDEVQYSDRVLVEYMDSLALLVKAGTITDDDAGFVWCNLFDLWVLGDDYIWTLYPRIGLFRMGWASPTGLCIYGDFLFLNEEKYVLHNPRTKQNTEIREKYIWHNPRTKQSTEIEDTFFYQREWNDYYIDSGYWSLGESLVRTTF